MWVTTDENQQAVGGEIERLEDRGAALVAAAFLESRLQELIESGFKHHDETAATIFRGAAPLGSFSAKIDLGYLLGHYDEWCRRTFHRVRIIRNEFAHNIQPTTFDSQRIRDLCDQLPPTRGDHAAAVEFPLDAIVQGSMTEAQSDQFDNWLLAQILNVSDTPRNRFMATIQMLLLLFGAAVKWKGGVDPREFFPIVSTDP